MLRQLLAQTQLKAFRQLLKEEWQLNFNGLVKNI